MPIHTRLIQVVHISTDARDVDALAAALHGVMTEDTYRVPVTQPLPEVTIGARIRLLLLLADGELAWSAEGIVAATVEGRSISIWRDGSSVEGPVASKLEELERDWDVTTLPADFCLDDVLGITNPYESAAWGSAASKAPSESERSKSSRDGGWEDETAAGPDAPDLCFATTTLELTLSLELTLPEGS